MKPNQYSMQGFKSPLFDHAGKSNQRRSLAERRQIDQRREHIHNYTDSRVAHSYRVESIAHQHYKKKAPGDTNKAWRPNARTSLAVDITKRPGTAQPAAAPTKPISRFVEPPSRNRP